VLFEATAKDTAGFDPKCCCFELWAKGKLEMVVTIGNKTQIIPVPHTLPGSGLPLSDKKFQQDSPRKCFSGKNFSAHDIPGHSIPLSDQKKLDNWRKLIGLNDQKQISITFRFRYEFEAKILDKCNDDTEISNVSYKWSLVGPIDAPKVTTSLKPEVPDSSKTK